MLTSDGAKGRNCVIWRLNTDRNHGDDDGSNRKPEAKIRNESVVSQGTDLRQEETNNDEDQRADDVAEIALRHFRDVLSKENCDLAEQQKKSNGLQYVDALPGGLAPCSKRDITVVACGKFERVDPHENSPDKPAAVRNEYPEDSKDGNTWTEPKGSHGVGNGKRSKNIGGNLSCQQRWSTEKNALTR